MDSIWLGLAGVGGGVSVSALAWLTFWLRWADRISKAEAIAEAALQEAAEAKMEIKTLHGVIEAYQQTFNEHQLTVAREYVDRTMMREVETRVIDAVEKAAKTTGEQIKQLTARVDSIVGGRRPQG